MVEKLVCESSPKTDVRTAIELIQNHGVVAFPTDTLYGIASSIGSRQAYGKG